MRVRVHASHVHLNCVFVSKQLVCRRPCYDICTLRSRPRINRCESVCAQCNTAIIERNERAPVVLLQVVITGTGTFTQAKAKDFASLVWGHANCLQPASREIRASRLRCVQCAVALFCPASGEAERACGTMHAEARKDVQMHIPVQVSTVAASSDAHTSAHIQIAPCSNHRIIFDDGRSSGCTGTKGRRTLGARKWMRRNYGARLASTARACTRRRSADGAVARTRTASTTPHAEPGLGSLFLHPVDFLRKIM